MKPRYAPPIYRRQFLNADGTYSTVAEIIAEMRGWGCPAMAIDRWVQGLELAEEIRAKTAAGTISLKGKSNDDRNLETG